MSDAKPPHDENPDPAAADDDDENPDPAAADDDENPDPAAADDLVTSKGEADDEDVADSGAGDDEFGDDELDDLDRLGVDGVVAALDDAPASAAAGRRRGRSPMISVVVLLACLYPLFSMFGDFRYFLSGSEPTDLGHASEFMAGGAPSGFANTYVRLEGTPDVQWATVATTKDRGKINYLRIREGGGQLFASVPRVVGEEELMTPRYAGVFVGRMKRLGDDRAFAWLQQLFAQEKVTRVVDTTSEDLASALASMAETVTVRSVEGPISLHGDDLVRFVVKPPDARVLLGVESFSKADADTAIASLGAPYLRIEGRSPDFHSYVVHLDPAQHDAARDKLRAAIEGEVDASDHKEGVSVFGFQAAYFAPIGDVTFSDGAFVFPYASNTTSPGYVLVGGAVQERALNGQPFRVPTQHLAAVRLEQPIKLDPDGYIVEVGVEPGSQIKWAVLWLMVLTLFVANVAVLYFAIRPRAR